AARTVHALVCDTARALGVDLTLGRRLLQLVEATELTDVAHAGTSHIWRGAPADTTPTDSAAILQVLTSLVDVTAPPPGAMAAWLAALQDPTFAIVGPTLHSVSARRRPL